MDLGIFRVLWLLWFELYLQSTPANPDTGQSGFLRHPDEWFCPFKPNSMYFTPAKPDSAVSGRFSSVPSVSGLAGVDCIPLIVKYRNTYEQLHICFSTWQLTAAISLTDWNCKVCWTMFLSMNNANTKFNCQTKYYDFRYLFDKSKCVVYILVLNHLQFFIFMTFELWFY